MFFNPTEEHLRSLEHLAAQGSPQAAPSAARNGLPQSWPILVIDNSPAANVELTARLTGLGVHVLHHGNRDGIAGGLNRGLEWLFSQGADAVVLFDQDSVVPEGYLSDMQAFIAGRNDAFLAGPRIFDENTGGFLPEFAGRGWSLRRLRFRPEQRPERCAFLISSGCLVSRSAYETLGPMDRSLYIDHVDTEYCLRAHARGVPLYVIPSLVLHHRIGSSTHHRLGPWKVSTTNHPWNRRYYFARNGMTVALRYGLRQPFAHILNLLTLGSLVLIVLYERDKLAKLASILCGLCDGMLGRLGPLEQTSPRLAARHHARTARA